MTNNKARVAAQTASIGNKDMMTFMPSPTAESSSQTETAHEDASSQNINIDNNDQLNTNVTTGDTSGMVPDPLSVRTAMDRGESMDDFTFNASLDALLTDPGSYDNSNDITQQGIILPQPPTPAATAMETLINGGINVSDGLLDSSAAAVGGGRKRKAPPTRLLSDMSSITNSSGSSEIPRLSSAPLLQQDQQSRGGGSAPVQQQLQAAASAPNLNFSSRSIIQLPPGMFANQQPISVSTTACPGPTVQQGVGNTNISQLTNRLYLSSSGVGGGVGGGAQQQVSALGNTAGVQQQQQAIQVASLTIPPHKGNSSTATSGVSSGMADLMSQIALPTTQNSTQVQGQSSSQVQGQLQIPGISTNPWDALMANAATSAVQQPSTASALQQAVAAAYPSQAAVLPSAVPSSLSAAKGQRRPSLPKAPLLSNNMQRKRPYQKQDGTGLAVSEDESERKKRRNERNLREQERSHKITERISELKNVLSEAGVHFKPDRYSTLVSVVSYIKTLQQRSALLDEEHRKLLDTIAGADKLVKANGGGSLIPSLSGAATATAAAIASKAGSNNPILPLSAKGIIPATAATTNMTTVQTHEKTANDPPSVASSLSNNDEDYLMFVKGIDYKSIFTNCGVAMAIASVDGRFVDCNEEFLKVTNYTRTELLGDSPRRTSLPHPQDDNTSPSSDSLKPNGQKQQGQAVTVSTTASTNKSSPLLTAVKKTPDVPASNSTCSHDSTSSPPPTKHSTDRPPKEIHMRKQHLSLFNLLGGKDMEAVYSAMSRMLRAPEHYSSSTAYESGGTSSSSDSFVKSDLTRSGAEESSSGNEGKREAAISRYTVDHWSGQVVHTRRKNHMLQLNISLVRTATGRPKFFNVSLSEVETTPKEVKV